MKQIILASTSPRRRKLLRKLDIKFKAVNANYKENIFLKLPPNKLVQHLSEGKAKNVAKRYDNSIIIAADTIVVIGKKVLGKPHSKKAASKMLNLLSGKKHSVITGFTIIDTKTGKKITSSVETKIYFKRLAPKEIKKYLETGEPLDKAGAYAIQGLGAAFIKKIEGDFNNVVGLPLFALSNSLKEFIRAK